MVLLDNFEKSVHQNRVFKIPIILQNIITEPRHM